MGVALRDDAGRAGREGGERMQRVERRVWRMRARGRRNALEGGVGVTHARRREGKGMPVEGAESCNLRHACREMAVGRLSGVERCLNACVPEGGKEGGKGKRCLSRAEPCN